MLSALIIGLLLQGAPAVIKAKPAADPNKKVCRTEAETGSVMGHRVCHTRAEWAAMESSDAQYRDGFRDRSTNMAIPR